jgi:hypothetical protein
MAEDMEQLRILEHHGARRLWAIRRDGENQQPNLFYEADMKGRGDKT